MLSVPVLDLMLEHADDLRRNAVEAEVLAERVLAGEELFLRVGADHRDARMREVVGLADEDAFRDIHLAHAAIRSIYAADTIVRATRAVCDHAVLECFRGNALQEWELGAD